MFFNFVDELRAAGIQASFKEHLVLLEALDKDVIEQTPEQFYYLSRSVFVKDEGLLDRFDQVFNKVFKGLLTDYGQNPVDIPEDWLKAVAEKGKQWMTDHEVHSAKVEGPWPHGDRFIVRFTYDVTNRPSGQRLTLEEAALFTVANDKIVREEFFYAMG